MEQISLFDNPQISFGDPLASRLRPRGLDEYIGQEHLLGEGKILRQMIEKDMVGSMIFWGPPGVGKTTLARIIANRTKASFIDFSAVTSGIKEIKEVMKQAETDRYMGTSFEINSALLSRCKVFVLQALTVEHILRLMERALTDKRGLGNQKIQIDKLLLKMIATFADGDGRTYEQAKLDAQKMLSEPVPLVIRNAPTALMGDLHYGEGYVYAHDTEEKLAHMTCLPESLKNRKYYKPTSSGAEAAVAKRLAEIEAFRKGE